MPDNAGEIETRFASTACSGGDFLAADVDICRALNFRDLGKYLAIGLALAAAVAAFVPTSIVQRHLGLADSPWAILTAVPISAIIELCSEGFSVLAGQLYTMGASLGVVFVMLMVGVTTDFTEISVVWGKFGKRSAVAYVLVSTIIAVVIGYLINLVTR